MILARNEWLYIANPLSRKKSKDDACWGVSGSQLQSRDEPSGWGCPENPQAGGRGLQGPCLEGKSWNPGTTEKRDSRLECWQGKVSLSPRHIWMLGSKNGASQERRLTNSRGPGEMDTAIKKPLPSTAGWGQWPQFSSISTKHRWCHLAFTGRKAEATLLVSEKWSYWSKLREEGFVERRTHNLLLLGKYYQRIMSPSFPKIENACSEASL